MIREVLKDYRERKELNEAKAIEKKEELYERVPELAEIESQIGTLGLKALKATMRNPENAAEIKNRFAELLEELKMRKSQIYKKYSISSDYLEVEYDCMSCKDTGFTKDGKKCKCLEQRLVSLSYKNSNMENTLLENNFENFDFTKFSDEEIPGEDDTALTRMYYIYEVAKNFVNKFNEKETPNLLFMGGVGLGKTYMSSCIAKELIDSGNIVIYQKTARIMDVLEDKKFNRGMPDEVKKNYDRLYECDLLIIDDLGTELMNSFTIAELFLLLDTRIMNKKKTIISTNLSLAQIKEQYTDRIFSRLAENFQILKFLGKDLRWER